MLELSFELLAAIIRAKLGSGEHIACCFGAYIFTPNGTPLRHKWQIYEHAGIQGQSCVCASYRAWFGASFAPIWACLIFLVGPELGIKQPTQVWLRGMVWCVHADPAVIYQKLRKSFYNLLITRLYYGGFRLHYRQYRCYRDSIAVAT